jgi:hypothetical protein
VKSVSRFDPQFRAAPDRRLAPRRRIFVAGSAVTIHGSKSVIVENLSTSGARIRGQDLPPVGRKVLIWIEGLDVLGTVSWAKNLECGIRFDVPLDPAALTCLEEQAVSTLFAIGC